MKAISLFKLLTLVCFLLVGQFAMSNETKEQCKARIQKDKKSEVESTCNSRTVTTTDKDGNRKEQPLTATEKTQCIKSEFETLFSSECGDMETVKDQKASCKSLLEKYDEGAKKTTEECARMGEENAAKCVAKAKSCSQGLDVFAEPGSDGEDSTASALVNLIGVYGRMQGATGANGQSVAGCVIENSDSEADKEERLDDKITRLRDEIAKLRNEDPAEEDEKLNEKRQDVEEKMLEARQENEKSQNEAKTKNQEEAGRLAEKIIKANAEKRNRLNAIVELNDQIAESAFEIQKVVLEMSDTLITSQCDDSRAEYQNNLQTQRKGKKYSNLELQKDTVKVNEVHTVCLKRLAAERQKKINSINKSKRRFQREISNLQAKNADDAATMANDQKQIESLKAIATEKEKKDLENLTTKLNNLNKSVTDMEASVERRKKSFEEKAKAKEDQINKILQDRQNVKSKFAKVYTAASSGGSSARAFVSQCCATDRKTGGDTSRKTVSGFAEACTRVRSDYDIKDAKVSTTKPGTSK